MVKKRLIAVLLVKDGEIVQSVQFRHTNTIHSNPVTAIDFFDRWAVDEIVVLDVTREKSDRERFYRSIDQISAKCFVPLTVGGWVDSVEEMRKLLRTGADKVVINTQAIRSPDFITQCARTFGSQCVVVSIDAKRHSSDQYEVYFDRGRVPSGLDVSLWAKDAERLGAGEIFLNCIDNDGFRKGYDVLLLRNVVESVRIPVVAMGGVLTWQHLVDGVKEGQAAAVAAANIFHYTEHSTKKAKAFLKQAGIDVR